MNINIKSTRIELTDEIKNYVYSKFESLNKLFSNSNDALVEIEIGKDSNHHAKGDVYKAEANVTVGGRQHYVLVIKDELHSAVDELRDQMAEKIKSSKEKSRSKFRHGAIKVKNFVKGFWPWGDNSNEE